MGCKEKPIAGSLLIIGASVRAAAWSVLRSGRALPWCIDLFADADLQGACTARAIPASAYPSGFLDAARQAPPGPWLYTGAMENHPDLIDAIARERTLWGNSAHTVRKVRSPALVAKVLQQNGLPCPDLAETPPLDSAKSWLIKPGHSAGGAHIRFWHGGPIPRSCYCQEWIDGDACSALFVGRRDNSALFLGATRQLIGVPWLHADAFRYCGTIGPMALPPNVGERLQKLGDALTQTFCLRGFFGVDFIWQGDVPWPVEINPRFTAGLEVLERAAGHSFFPHHHEVFSPSSTALEPPCSNHLAFSGKAILFAKGPLTFPDDGPWEASLRHSWTDPAGPEYADIPHPRTFIEKGRPILTLFARAATEADCLAMLRHKALALDRHLFG